MNRREAIDREAHKGTGSSRDPGPSAFDDLSVLLPDWRRHLRASNRAPLTIESYLKAGKELLDFLQAAGMPTAVHDVTREHIEAHLVSMHERGCASSRWHRTNRCGFPRPPLNT